jgi:muramoyltetrapeptide carboxypeptidase
MNDPRSLKEEDRIRLTDPLHTLLPPRALPPGGHIAVVAPAGPSERARIEEAAQHIERRGYRVTIAANVDHRFNTYLAGPDDERLAELNHYLRSDDVDAILCARGGYGAMRILDRVDYDALARNPRPLVGFSDITALHQAIAVRCGIGSFHGPMLNLDFFNRLSPEIEQWLWSILGGDAPLTHRFAASQVICQGEAEGVLFGGCLSLTTALTGTPYDFWIDDGIWFFEDVDEPLYRIDRMLTHLRLSGRLKKIRGVLIGKLKNCGSEAELHALLVDFFASHRIPVVRDLPFGHQGDNLVMPIGAPVRVSTSDCTFTVTRAAVQR